MHEIYILNYVYLIIQTSILREQGCEDPWFFFRYHYGVREQTGLENIALTIKPLVLISGGVFQKVSSKGKVKRST